MLYTTLSRNAALALDLRPNHNARPLPIFEHVAELFRSSLRKVRNLGLAKTDPPPCKPDEPCPGDDTDINPRVSLTPSRGGQVTELSGWLEAAFGLRTACAVA